MGCSASLLAEPQRFAKTYRLGDKLAAGTFGQVHAATHVASGNEHAVKVLRRSPDRADQSSRQEVEPAESELALWRVVGRHEHCVELFGAFFKPGAVYLTMERCRCSFKAVLPHLQRLELSELGRLLREAFQGICHLHHAGLVHRDVKPENLLLGGPTGWTVKVCDFGVAARLPQKGCLWGACGTVYYMSPEMVADDSYDGRTDVWSLGVVAHLLLLRELPYSPSGKSKETVKEAVLSNRPPLSLTGRPPPSGQALCLWQAAIGCLEALLQRSPARRPRAAAALLLPFLSLDIDEVDTLEWSRSASANSTPSTAPGGLRSACTSMDSFGSGP